MKKAVFILLAVICMNVQAQKPMPLDPIKKLWITKSIKVSGGDNILQLVSAFQQAWPTYSGFELLKFSKSKTPYDNNDKIVDIKNGFVFYSEDDPDAESDEIMSACVWNRQNGHKLFAVSLSRMSPSKLHLLLRLQPQDTDSRAGEESAAPVYSLFPQLSSSVSSAAKGQESCGLRVLRWYHHHPHLCLGRHEAFPSSDYH